MEAMPYTQSLLANGMAIGYHARAAPPTVTMPRLKVVFVTIFLVCGQNILVQVCFLLTPCFGLQAMVSGAIGGFLDVALNFNTQAMVDDNLLGKLILAKVVNHISCF